MTTRLTPLRAELDTLIAGLVGIRTRSTMAADPWPETGDDVRAQREIAMDMARAMDPMFKRIARHGGLTTMSGASPYANIVSNAVSDWLGDDLAAEADRLDEAAHTGPEFTQESHGTLDLRTQGMVK